MKRIIKLLALAATFAVLAIPAVAQADQCNDDNKGTWYKTFFDNYKGDVAAQKVIKTIQVGELPWGITIAQP